MHEAALKQVRRVTCIKSNLCIKNSQNNLIILERNYL